MEMRRDLSLAERHQAERSRRFHARAGNVVSVVLRRNGVASLDMPLNLGRIRVALRQVGS
jgi:hypothetical protein